MGPEPPLDLPLMPQALTKTMSSTQALLLQTCCYHFSVRKNIDAIKSKCLFSFYSFAAHVATCWLV